MSRPRSAQGLHRVRTNSQSHIESAISAIQQSESLAREAAAASAGFVPGTGGFIGGPPVSPSSPHPAAAAAVSRGASVRHRKDPTLALWNGNRVRTNDRICKDVPPPAANLPSEPQFWSYANPHAPRPSLPFLKAHFEAEGRLTEDQAMYIIDATALILRDEPNIIKVGDGVTVCGDIHGQYYDLLKLFEVGGDPTKTPYLFLGDYVDRGAFGIECLLYLYVLKLHFPKSVFLLRGNHECRNLTEFFTFKTECLHKYSSKVYEACIRSFQALPLAALLDGRFLCVHGGIGPDMKTLADLEKVHRFQEPGMEGILCDILWADPIEGYSRVPDPGEPALPRVRRYAAGKGKGKKGKGKGKGKAGSDDEGELLPPGFVHNTIRGCSYFYTYTAVCEFLQRNGLLSVIRGHEAQDAGYSMYRATPHAFPSLITIFSAPNYLDAYNNRAAVIKYVGQHITIRQFNASAHPYSLPGFMDAFTWSLPFVGAKIAEMLLAILNCCTEEELEETTDEEEAARGADEATREELAQRHDAIKNKVLAVGRMARVFDLLREEAENVSELAVAGADGHDAQLDVQTHRVRRAIHNFDEARRSDIRNEHVPGRYANPRVGRAATWDGGAGAGAASLVVRRRSTAGDAGDTGAMIRRALAGGGAGEEEGELMRLAVRVSRAGGAGAGGRRVVRGDTAP